MFMVSWPLALLNSCENVAVNLQVTLKLIETFVDKCEDIGLVIDRLVPAMMDPILGDYARNVPDARYALFLSAQQPTTCASCSRAVCY